LFDVHSSIENTNDDDCTLFDRIENDAPVGKQATQGSTKFAAIRTQKREITQLVKSVKEPGDDPVSSSGT